MMDAGEDMIDRAPVWLSELAAKFDTRSAVWLSSFLYAALAGSFLIARGQAPPWELVAMALISVVGWRCASERVWVELLPFAQLLLAYRGLNGFAAGLTPGEINIVNLIAWEKGLFAGVIPSAWLQTRLFGRPYTGLLDAIANLLYVSHFVAPVAVAALVRGFKKLDFWVYMLGFFALAYLGFATYLLFPAAPPWWATRFGYLSGVDSVSLEHFIIAPETMFKTPNPLAAMPSMHCAYPLFMALACRRLWGGRANWMLALPVGVGVSVIYLGHHYVVDALAGYVYALFVWWIWRGRVPSKGSASGGFGPGK